MGDIALTLLALGLPWVAGAGVVVALLPARSRGTALLAAGAGLVLGAALAGIVMRLGAGLTPLGGATVTACVLVALTIAAAVLRLRQDRAAAAVTRRFERPVGFWTLAGLGTVGVIVALNGYWMIGEIIQRPLLGWDGWKVWAVRPQVWFAVSPAVEFVDVPAWLAANDPGVHTVPGHHYPELLGRFQLWHFALLDRWDPALGHLVWAGAWAALIVGCLGLLRLAGATWSVAATVALLLALAPFPATHGALPGYMDLWIAAQLLFATGFTVTWLRTGRTGPLLLALGFAAALALTKVEGVVWALILAACAALGLLSDRARLVALATGAGLLLLWFALGGFELSLFGQPFVLRPDLIDLPGLGRAELVFENRLGFFAGALFMYPNWHVLGALLALAVPLALLAAAPSPTRGFARGFVMAALGFLFVLFNFTEAGYWAEDLTASNRLTLHVLPAFLWLVAALYVEGEAPTHSA